MSFRPRLVLVILAAYLFVGLPLAGIASLHFYERYQSLTGNVLARLAADLGEACGSFGGLGRECGERTIEFNRLPLPPFGP